MGPFPPEIEAPLLQRLRTHEVWPCFAKSSRKIGRLGARVKGYWESKRSEAVEKNDLRIENRFRNEDGAPEIKDNVTTPFSISGHVLQGKLVPREERINNETLFTLITLWERFLQQFSSLVPDFANHIFPGTKLPLWVLHWYRRWALTIFYPLTIRGWKFPFDEQHGFFTSDFVLPRFEDQKFTPNKVIGTYMSDLRTLCAVDEDKEAQNIYYGSVLGVPTFALRPNPIQALQFTKVAGTILYSQGEVWVRSLECRLDGQPVVLLKKYRFVEGGSDCLLVYFQDVSDLYAEYLQL